MSAHISSLPRPLLPDPTEIKASLVCWGAYIVLLSCYCTLYQVVVDSAEPDLFSALVHVCRNWGVWLLTTPLVFQAWRKLSRHQREGIASHLRFVAIVLAVSVAVPVTIDLHTQERSMANSLFIFLPRYICTMLVVYMIWHTFVRKLSMSTDEPAMDATLETSPLQELESSRPALTTLLVSKGADECLIQLESIESLSAAGNYVEIAANGQCYLLRAPLKQVEDMLPTEKFLRIHRSHIVKREAITRIKTQPSGNGTVELRTGRALPMSKRHRAELQRFRVAFD
ncbi:MAG: LytTR family DNA-binding domain-containing protein [Steroidobacter sp.]